MPKKSKQILLTNRPQTTPSPTDFQIAQDTIAPLRDGQIMVRNLYMSVDPYMRGRMRDGPSYSPPWQLNQVMDGRAVGEIIETKAANYKKGDRVASMCGWRDVFTLDADMAYPLPDDGQPIQAHLGVLGMPGLTAYHGLLNIGKPKAGETVLVSAASGAVGALVCQISKIKGARVVAIAGSDDKCNWLRNVVGVDAAINYKTTDNLRAEIRSACPDGIDIYFENVGGETLQIALDLINPFGRIPLCGMISIYNLAQPEPGPNNLAMAIGKSLTMQGFIVSNHLDQLPAFYRDMNQWISEGKIVWEETIYEGLERAPEAFIDLFSGANTGKMIVKI